MNSNTINTIFAYCRVSTAEQTTDNQVKAILEAGYEVPPHHVVSETCSGSLCAASRPRFQELLTKLRTGDTLVTLKMDRLGRNSVDVQQTIEQLIEMGVKPIILNFPVHDLTSSSGRLILQMLANVAEFERSLIQERTREGLARAKAEGKLLGRPKPNQRITEIHRLQSANYTQKQVAEFLNISVRTVSRHWKRTQKKGRATK